VTSAARVSWAEQQVRDRCFGGDASVADAPLTFGAELEFLALDAGSHRVVPVLGRSGTVCSVDLVREVARRLAWRETVSDKGIPRFVSDAGGALTFEPGGQLEYATTVHRSVDGVLRELCVVETLLRESAEPRGVMLLACGVDPFNGPDVAPLQLHAERYERMARYFATIGTDGARMMRQTASLQVNVGGVAMIERWAVANAIAPVLVALFANSTHYAGCDTGCASYRAETWRGVDCSRTGLFEGRDPVREYTAFALSARAFLSDESAPQFGVLDGELVSEASFVTHLTTLFPEVRPRGYLEVRSLDAVDADRRAAAMALIAGLLGDDEAARDARDLLGSADAELLRSAGREGMRNFRIAAFAGEVTEIALAGCTRLGPTIVAEETAGAMTAHFRHLLALSKV
jgi:glutamate--cysteine ligase